MQEDFGREVSEFELDDDDDDEIESIDVSSLSSIKPTLSFMEEEIIDDEDDDELLFEEILDDDGDDEEDENLLPESVEPLLLGEKEEDTAVAKSNETRKISPKVIQKNFITTLETNVKAISGIKEYIASSLNSSFTNAETKKIIRELSVSIPSCLTSSMAADIRKNIGSFYGDTIEDFKRFLVHLSATYSYNNYSVIMDNTLSLNIAFEYALNIRKRRYYYSKDISNTYQKREHESINIVNYLLDGQPTAFNEPKDNKPVIVSKIKSSNNEKSFVCGNCGKESPLPGNLISLCCIRGEVLPIFPPLECECGHQNIIEQKVINRLVRELRSKVQSQSTLGLSLYVPGFNELSGFLEDSLEFNESTSNTTNDSVINSNWDNLVKEFINKENAYYTEHNCTIDADSTVVNHKILAKILAFMFDDYETIKENAMASLILYLEESNMGITEADSIENNIPYYYRDKVDTYREQISLRIPTNLEEPEKFYDDFKRYCSNAEKYNDKRISSIQELGNYTKFLAGTRISNNRLTESMICDYLSEPILYDLIDKVSDYMIIASKGEELLNFLSPRVTKTTELATEDIDEYVTETSNRRDASYNITLKKLRDGKINSKDKIIDYIANLVEYFNGDISKIHEFGYLYFKDNLSSIQYMCRYLLKYDYYEAYKHTSKLLQIDDISRSTDFARLTTMLHSMPTIPNNVSKFEFYFGNKNFTEEEKDKILVLFSKKKVIPKNLSGDTFEEFYSNYEKSSDYDEIVSNKYTEFIDNNYNFLVALSCYDTSYYKDSIDGMLGRDLLFSTINHTTVAELCNSFYINEGILPIILECDLTIKKPENKYKDLFRILLFSDEYLQTSVLDEDITDEAISSLVDQQEETILEEFKDFPIPLMIAKKYFGRE